jgi:hypothetical protein
MSLVAGHLENGDEMTDQSVSQFFTWGSLGTLAGATSATFVVTNTIQSAIGWSAKWAGLAIAEVICLGAAYLAGQSGADYIIALLNGCLVYLSAAGATAAGTSIVHGPPPTSDARGWQINRTGESRPGFLSPWF